MIMTLGDYKNKLVIDEVKLESTKRALFFYKGAVIFNNCQCIRV